MIVLPLVLLLAAQESYESTLREGLEALKRNDLPAAEARLETACRLNSRDPHVWVALAQTRWKLHRNESANDAASKASRLGDSDAATVHALAIFYTETGNAAAASAEYRRAIQLSPYEENNYFQLGRLYLQREDFENARKTLQQGAGMFDKSAQLELALGVAYYGLRRFPEAIDAFLRTVELAPEVEQPYVFLGKMLEQAGPRLPAITAVFTDFARSNPQSYLGPFLSARALALQDPDSERLEPLLHESIRLNGGFASSHFELGAVLERRRLFSEAAREYGEAIRLDPNDPVPHYRLARVFDRLGRQADAERERAMHKKLSAGKQSEGE